MKGEEKLGNEWEASVQTTLFWGLSSAIHFYGFVNPFILPDYLLFQLWNNKARNMCMLVCSKNSIYGQWKMKQMSTENKNYLV